MVTEKFVLEVLTGIKYRYLAVGFLNLGLHLISL